MDLATPLSYFIVLLILLIVIPMYHFIITGFQLTKQMLWMLIGMGGGVLFNIIFKHSVLWNTFWHELTHLLWAKLFRAEVGTIMVSRRRGGYISHSGTNPYGLLFIALAPYFFPTVSLLLLIIKMVVKTTYQLPIACGIGFTLSLFYVDVYQTLQIPQPDIEKVGKVRAAFFIIILHLFFLGFILASMMTVRKQAQFFNYLWHFWQRMIHNLL